MRCKTVVLLCASAAAMAPMHVTRADDALTKAPVDYSLFREGEVRRAETRFRGWLLTCDEVRRLGQKFCSMRSVARSADGTVVAAVTVSTDTRGRPAAILTLPFGTALASGVRISYAEGSKPVEKAAGSRLLPSQCGGLGCQAVWPLEVEAVRQLRAGRAISLAFARRTDASFANLDLASGAVTIAGVIDGAGFSEALAASMR